MAGPDSGAESLPHRDEPGGGRNAEPGGGRNADAGLPVDPARHAGAGLPVDPARHAGAGLPVDPARHAGGGRPRPAEPDIARRGACPRGGTIPTVRVPRVPIYTPTSVRPVHNLHYDWTGWFDPSATDLAALERHLDPVVQACRSAWTVDGITLDTWALSVTDTDAPRLQCLFTASPEVSPVLCAGRAKGRLDHALRQAGVPHRFTRNVGFRSLGENTREIVERYIGRQAAKSDYIDPRFKAYLGQFTVGDAAAMLAAPCAAGHGRYWYNLHLVIVVADRRFPMTRPETFLNVRQTCFRIAAKKGHTLASVSVMPDHVHLALRGNIEHAPLEIGLGYLNNLAFVLGYHRCWSEEFYAGTFSEYGLDQLRG